jgi:uncharacterized protein (TIGR03435 family)
MTLITGPVWEHLWQSTLFALLAASLAAALKNERAHVRFAVWLAASLKFLVPFSLLVNAGHLFSIASPRIVPASGMNLVSSSSQPIADSARQIRMVAGSRAVPETSFDLAQALFVIWSVGAAIVLLYWVMRWRQVRRTIRFASSLGDARVSGVLDRLIRQDAVRRRVRLVVSDDSIEPAVFGILRPVLLWPRQLTNRLHDDQIAAILEHELAHVRRRDNLSALLHAAVQAVFWFHPLVWWVGRRLVEEREHACDEAVLSRGSSPQVYAESILQTCWRSVQLRGACVASVAGSGLAARIERIMRGPKLMSRRWLRNSVIAAGTLSLLSPVAMGLLTPRVIAAQLPSAAASFVTRSAARSWDVTFTGDAQLRFVGFTGRDLVRHAYGLETTPVVDGPEWLDTEPMSIAADVPSTDGPATQAALQTIFEQQFGLQTHRETRNLPVLALVAAAGGPGLQFQPAADCVDLEAWRAAGSPQPGLRGERTRFCGGADAGPFGYTFTGATMKQIAAALRRPAVDLPVVDATGLDGRFDGHISIILPLLFMRNQLAEKWPVMDFLAAPSLAAAMREQVGLTLEPATLPTDVLVIDRMVRP